MPSMLLVSSDAELRNSLLDVLPSNVTVTVSDGDLESIVAAVRGGPIDVVWDLAAEWTSPQVLLGLVLQSQIDRCRWFWLRREQTRWEDIPDFGESLLLPMSPELIVSGV